MLGFADHAPLAAPTFAGAVGEVFELASRLAGGGELFLGDVKFPPRILSSRLFLARPNT